MEDYTEYSKLITFLSLDCGIAMARVFTWHETYTAVVFRTSVYNSLSHRGHQHALELSVAGQQFWAPLSYLFEVHWCADNAGHHSEIAGLQFFRLASVRVLNRREYHWLVLKCLFTKQGALLYGLFLIWFFCILKLWHDFTVVILCRDVIATFD